MKLLENSDPTQTWKEIRVELRRLLGDSTYELWIAPLQLKALEDECLLLTAPPGTQAWIAKRFGPLLERCAQTVVGGELRVAFDAGARSATASSTDAPEPNPLATLNPRHSFDQFIIGDGNRLAHAAALAVAELPGAAYNPLFLYGPPGLGKTHLLHAIGNYITAFGGARVRYTTVESFTNHFITALGTRSLAAFKRAYRDVDVLLIDDVQFLASKAKTEEEFFHTFNALYENGRQLVLTCDRLPSALTGVEERLRERFAAGLVANIEPPDLPTRLAILRKRATLDKVPLEDDAVLELVATRITDNVRALEGALVRVVAYHSLTRRPISVELARTVLDAMYPQSRSLSTREIKEAVAERFGLTVTELCSGSRVGRISWARQLAIYLSRELTGSSLQAIGEEFGGRNHATVLHACKRVAHRVAEDQDAMVDLDELQQSLTPTG